MKTVKVLMATLLCFGLVACNSKPSEEDTYTISMNGHTINVGAWTVEDLYANGFSVGIVEGDTATAFTAEEMGAETIEARTYYDDVELFYGDEDLGTVSLTNASTSDITFLEGTVTTFYTSNNYAGFDTIVINGVQIDPTDIDGTCTSIGGTTNAAGSCSLTQTAAGKNNVLTLSPDIIADDGSISSVMLVIEKE